ncbi:MAG TPA: DUF2934 domain-containing protein [Bryobacteraceae bacterium]|jgi:hypothetical protein|nr:DUF2934 domain-containing protein [Bryobacteraceae bacterium]
MPKRKTTEADAIPAPAVEKPKKRSTTKSSAPAAPHKHATPKKTNKKVVVAKPVEPAFEEIAIAPSAPVAEPAPKVMAAVAVEPIAAVPTMPVSRPTNEEIALRAYLIWEARGGQSGSDLDDWLQAEKELLAERQK